MFAGSTATPPTSAVNDQASIPSSREERPRHAPGRDPRRGLARGGAFEHVPHVAEPVLQGAGEVGVAGPDAGDRCGTLVAVGRQRGELGGRRLVERLDLHHLRPVLPVAIGDEEEDRRTERHAMAHTGDDLGAVVLDLLARPAAIAALPAGEVDLEGIGREREPGRDALDRHAQRLAVRLARGQEAEGSHRRAGRVTRRGRRSARRPAHPRRNEDHPRAPRRASAASARAVPAGPSTA